MRSRDSAASEGGPGAVGGSIEGQHVCGSRISGQAAPGARVSAAQVGEDLAGDVALEAAHDFSLGQAFFESAFDVTTCFWMAGHAGHDDPPESGVGLPVAAAMQPMTAAGLPARGGDWSDAAEPGEAGFGVQPGRVVAGRDE